MFNRTGGGDGKKFNDKEDMTGDCPMNQGQARVKFLRKALTPKTQEQFEEFCQSCEILISTPLKLAQLTEQFNFECLEIWPWRN